MNRRANDASPEPAPHLGIFLVATGDDQECKPEMIRTFLQKNVGPVRIVTSSRSYTNDKTFLTMEFASPCMVKDAIDMYNYTKVAGCLININRFRSKNMQGRNSFGGFQKGFTVKQDGSRHGRIHQTIRGMQMTKVERERAMDERMRQMSPRSAARYINQRKHSKRDPDRSRSRSRSSSGSPRSRRRRYSYSPSYSRSRSRSRSRSYSRSRSRSRSASVSNGRGGRRRHRSPSRSVSRSRSRSRSHGGRSHTRSRSRSHSPLKEESRSRSPGVRRRRKSKRKKRSHRSDDEREDEKGLDGISPGEVVLSVPLDSLTDEEQKQVQEKRTEMTMEFRQDCNTMVQVARLFSSYTPHMEHDLEKALRRSLAGIGQAYVTDFEGWLKENIPHAVADMKQNDTTIEAT